MWSRAIMQEREVLSAGDPTEDQHRYFQSVSFQ